MQGTKYEQKGISFMEYKRLNKRVIDVINESHNVKHILLNTKYCFYGFAPDRITELIYDDVSEVLTSMFWTYLW